MKLTTEERRVIEERRKRNKERVEQRKKEDQRWAEEQKRMDRPGLGCLNCEKSIREVHYEGRYIENNRVNSMGWVSICQWTGGGAMTEKESTSLFEAELCHDCLLEIVEKLKKLKKE